MSSSPATDLDLAGNAEARQARLALQRARSAYYEEPGAALDVAIRCQQAGRSLGDMALCARACVLQGMVSVHRGDLHGGLELALEAERHAEVAGDDAARAELAALKAQLGLFTGSYAEALRQAEIALERADAARDLALRVHVRRATCPVFAAIGVPDLRSRVEELLALALEHGSRWEEAISRNDLACHLHEQGRLDEAEAELERAEAAAVAVDGPSSFALAVIHSTRADIRLGLGRAQEALADAERAIELLSAVDDPNPYVLGATVRADIEARMALGRLEDARQAGEGALSWLGERMPQTRSLVLSTLAETLRAAGRVEEAYDALARAAELERIAFRELSELQLKLERTTLEASAQRVTNEALEAKNRQLADAHAELARRARELEALQGQLREQAERDWLTGLHNRRYFAQEIERLGGEAGGGSTCLAILDLDHFKSINDRFGHDTGDRVLIRVAALLCEVLRQSDTIVRSGGEEFLVLMPETEMRAATACCERIRRRIREEPWEQLGDGLAVTTSIGLACTDDPARLVSLARAADQRLYEAKRAGRDRVVGESRESIRRPPADGRRGSRSRAC